MKKIVSLLGLFTLFLCVISCAKDIVNVNGTITGVVKDYDDGHLIQNCQVSLSPVGTTSITSSDGQFIFSDLEPGSYTLTFSKSGYTDQNKTVTVTSGQSTDASITLKSKGTFALSETNLNFGDLNGSLSFSITNNSDSQCSYEISNIPAWASFSKKTGTVSAQGVEAITVTVDREKLDYGTFNQVVSIAYKGNTQGTATVTLTVSKVKLSAPEVKIAANAQNITQNSFEIGGELVATGGSVVTDYGHCWSLTQNPTINDSHSSNGSTQEVGEFSTTVSNLTVGTTYYVRAYATNAQGTSYSSELIVTTQDVESNKWDGNIAKKFAGGKGTAGSPYLVETGGQLLLMKEYSDKYFELNGNIDLDNQNWLPFSFQGKLDGKGYTISNLHIDRTDDNQGLFSSLSYGADVSNLTIKGVKIDAADNDNIGALCGYIYQRTSLTDSYVSIKNVHVVFTEHSVLIGNENVGGLVGSLNTANDNAEITDCQVSSISSDYVIKGSSNVGGIIGYAIHNYNNLRPLSSCAVSASIIGDQNVGGIVGYAKYSPILNCSYLGKISVNNYGGGIAGSLYESLILACKVQTDIVSSNTAGGMVGYVDWETQVIACYTAGSVKASKGDGIYGEQRLSSFALCYTTMACGLSNGGYVDSATTASKASGKNTVNNCTNITEHLKSAYSEYAEYYNFNKTWLYNGVSCPRLAWESGD